MSDEEGFDSVFDGAESGTHDEAELPTDGLRIVFDNELPDESRSVLEVGVIPAECVNRNHKLKKHQAGTAAKPAYVFPGVPLVAVRAAVDFLGNRSVSLLSGSVDDVKDVYAAAKLIGSESLIQACVDRVWDLKSEWLGLPADSSTELETECAWMYLVMSETEDL